MKHPRRSESRRRWADVAAGKFDDPELRAWLQSVAGAILKADDMTDPTGKQRPMAVLIAAGLAGRAKDATLINSYLRMLDPWAKPTATDQERQQLRAVAMFASQDGRWMTPGAVLGDPVEEIKRALLLAAAEACRMPPEVLETPGGRDGVQARIRAARKAT